MSALVRSTGDLVQIASASSLNALSSLLRPR